MIILKKERLLLIAICIIIAVSTFMFDFYKKEDTVATVSLPVSEKVVIIDARTWKS